MGLYEGPLLRYATRILGSLERAQEVVQETFFKLWKAHQPDVEPHLAQWLYTVCRNGALDVYRKEKRMKPLSETMAETLSAVAPAPVEIVGREQQRSHLLQLLDGLPEKQQEVLRLRFQAELSYKEIAAVTGLSVSNVGFLIHTAVRSLQAELKSKQHNVIALKGGSR